MKVTEFFLGFGPRIWSFRRGETEYGVQGDPRRRLRAHHRDEQPRGGRARRRGAHLPAEGLPAAPVGRPSPARPMHFLIAFVLFFVVIAGRGARDDGPSTTSTQVVAEQRRRTRPGCRPATGRRRSTARRSTTGTTLERVDPSHGRQPDRRLTVDARRHRADRRHARRAQPEDRDGGFLGVGHGTSVRDVGLLGAVPESFERHGHVGQSASSTSLGDRLVAVGRRRTSAQQSSRRRRTARGLAAPTSTGPMSLDRHRRQRQRHRRRDFWLLAAAARPDQHLPRPCSTCCRCCRSTAATPRSPSTSGSRRRCKHRRVLRRRPQADAGQRDAVVVVLLFLFARRCPSMYLDVRQTVVRAVSVAADADATPRRSPGRSTSARRRSAATRRSRCSR